MSPAETLEICESSDEPMKRTIFLYDNCVLCRMIIYHMIYIYIVCYYIYIYMYRSI